MVQVEGGVIVRPIVSGKLRRYHGVSVWQQLADIPTLLRNLRDLIAVALGFIQSVVLLLFLRPDVVFTKGGFVCLPVGMAAAFLRIPIVIHDSDAHPGLTNRILARWATKIATGAPLENYTYPTNKTTYVGIPVSSDFQPLTLSEKKAAKEKLALSPDKPLVVVTGGGLGAKRINDAVTKIVDELTRETTVIHVSGAYQYEELRQQGKESQKYILHPFIDNASMALALGAADVVVARAGATTLLELAAVGAPSIIIPNPMLTGGHQLKNAKVYADTKAAIVLDEKKLEQDPHLLLRTITDLLHHESDRKAMGERMKAFARPKAALDMAAIITSVVEHNSRAGE